MLASIPLASLHVDRSVSLRKSDCQATIHRYADCLRAGEVLPALDACVDENGEYWLADGFLRYDAHVLVGADEVIVRVQPGGARGARFFACGANDLHGRQRTVAEKRAAVERMLSDAEWKTWSDHVIADSCRVSHTFVAKMRTRLDNVENVENVEHAAAKTRKRTGRDGRPVHPRAARERPTVHAPASPPATPHWVRATPTAPGLCELPRLPVRAGLPAVEPARAAVAVDLLSDVRDFLLGARSRLIEAQAVAPDPNCPAVAEGMDHALAHLLPWMERLDPHFEEEGRPPQLPRVVEAAAHLPAERAALQSALASQGLRQPAREASPPNPPQPTPPVAKRPAPAPPAASFPAASVAPRAEPPADVRPPAILKSMWAMGAAPSAPPVPAERPPTHASPGYRLPWMTPEMTRASEVCRSGDRDAIAQMLAQQQAVFAGASRSQSLATLPNFAWPTAATGGE